MENKFTQGPWFYQEDSDAYTHIVRPEKFPGRIIHQGWQGTDGEHEANARLIAAAPTILAALEKAKSTICTLKRSMMAHPDCTEDSEFDGFTDMAQEVEDEIEVVIAKAKGVK